MSSASKTTDRETIRRWVARDGHPATVSATRKGDQAGVLRIDFEGTQPGGLERITWEQFSKTLRRIEPWPSCTRT